MGKAKRVSKKALSVLLTVAMLLTTFVFFDIGSMFGSAASVDGTFTVTDNSGDQKVYFYVPEAVYLEPSITAQSTQARYNYQWFADSAVDPTTHEATPRSGENALLLLRVCKSGYLLVQIFGREQKPHDRVHAFVHNQCGCGLCKL